MVGPERKTKQWRSQNFFFLEWRPWCMLSKMSTGRWAKFYQKGHQNFNEGGEFLVFMLLSDANFNQIWAIYGQGGEKMNGRATLWLSHWKKTNIFETIWTFCCLYANIDVKSQSFSFHRYVSFIRMTKQSKIDLGSRKLVHMTWSNNILHSKCLNWFEANLV